MENDDTRETFTSIGRLAGHVLDNLRAATQRKPEPETHAEPNSTNNAVTPTLTNAHATINNAMPVKANMLDLQRGGRARCPAASQGGNRG